MLWFDELAARVEGPQVVNDSKTPSGPVHVGALRGVLIHDAVYRALQDRDLPVRYKFGVDDYDPLDELPPTGADELRPFMGIPLCNVPAPAGSSAKNLAEHYIKDFFDIFDELGVGAETYRMSDVYRSGTFDKEIDTILRNADVVRRIDREISHVRRDDDWFPFQVICEKCGRIGTTKVTSYDGELVGYQCLPNLVKWAEGCGYKGKISPFGGNGKLPWKLEWVAKWNNFPVTIEGAGKDHNTKGGSRQVAAQCLKEIFHKDAPINIPYEFFLVGGAKMSSSRGVGVSAREMANLLPPELLRFLMIRSLPKQVVDFSPEQEKIVRLYNDFDRVRERAANPVDYPTEARMYEITQVEAEPSYYAPPFDLLLSLAQMPHLDPVREIERVHDAKQSPLDLSHVKQRVASARYWLRRFASDQDRFEVQTSLPFAVASLRAGQLGFLHKLAKKLVGVAWEPAKVQICLFDTARITPISQADGFSALYTVLLDRQSGPKAGNLLAFLEREFVIARLSEVPMPSVTDFWADTAITEQELEDWVVSVRSKIVTASAETFFERMGILELTAELSDSKIHLRRCIISSLEEHDQTGYDYFVSHAIDYVASLERKFGVEIPIKVNAGGEVRV
jgi:lysyl-tRNA synthetase class 1